MTSLENARAKLDYEAFLRELLDRFRRAPRRDDATLDRFAREGAQALDAHAGLVAKAPGAVETQVTSLPTPPDEPSAAWDPGRDLTPG